MSNRPNRRPTATRPGSAPPADRTKVLLVAGAIGLLVVVIGIVVAMAGGAGDDPDTPTGAAGATYGPVVVEDAGLPDFASTGGDPAIGQEAPRLEGTAPDGSPVTVSGSSGEPTLVAFVAHWCPHCQVEIPVIVDLMASGDLDGIRTVAVLTGTDERRPNFPPVAWLEREQWAGEIFLDDEAGTAARGYGLSSYPFLVFLDADGKVVARTSGEVPADDIAALADAAR